MGRGDFDISPPFRRLSAPMKDDPFKTTKLEKTGEKTFNVHTAGSGYFECETKKDLGQFRGVKDVNHVGAENQLFGGIGVKKSFVCDLCGGRVSKLRGFFSVKFNRFFYVCPNCKFDENQMSRGDES